MNWNLKKLYSDFESAEFKSDFDSIEIQAKALKQELLSYDNVDAKNLEKVLKKYQTLSQIFYKLYAYTYLKVSADAADEKAMATLGKLEEKEVDFENVRVSIEKFIGKCNDISVLFTENVFLQEHSFFITEIKENSKYLLSNELEDIIAKLQNTGSKAFSNLQNTVTSKLTVAYEGDELALSEIRNLAYSKDAETRKAAYSAEIKAYKQIEEPLAAALNSIKGESLLLTKMRGYNSPLESVLKMSGIKPESLDAMISAIKEYLPHFIRYFKHKAKLLGHPNGLPFYDLFAPMGNDTSKFSLDDTHKLLVEKFAEFSTDMSNFIDKAFNNEWIDSHPKKNKSGGAFCYNLHMIGESRILSNFDGSFSSVVTLAHELGHAFHGECLLNESFLNSDYPMPLAETASIFNETLLTNSMLKTLDKDNRLPVLESSLQDSSQVIVDILSRYIFETNLFNTRKDHQLSVNELKEMMLSAQKETYADGLDSEIMHPYMWACKSHYYSPSLHFYNFPYAFGLLFGKGVYSVYKQKGDAFVPQYKEMLAVSGKTSCEDAAMMMGIDLTDINFWRSSLDIIVNEIDEFVSL